MSVAITVAIIAFILVPTVVLLNRTLIAGKRGQRVDPYTGEIYTPKK